MKKITIGLIAHVDSGKTTLSEAILYETGAIRSFGRVDKGESFLDSDPIERKRGITIYSKQANVICGNTDLTILDTPGHEDFLAETERTLNVLDYALFIISGTEGITERNRLIWKLLEAYDIPVIIFFNKMDRAECSAKALLKEARDKLSDRIISFSGERNDEFHDQMAMGSEEAMEEYLGNGQLSEDTILDLIADRKAFPAFFGSALRQEGIKELLAGLDELTLENDHSGQFGARVYDIRRDPSGTRLTFMRITGGSLKNKTVLPDGENESKINRIRIYSGHKYEIAQEVAAAEICAVEGLENSFAGQGFGSEEDAAPAFVLPSRKFRVILPEDRDPVLCFREFSQIEEEAPELSPEWIEPTKSIVIRSFGRVQLEVLGEVLKERFGLEAGFEELFVEMYEQLFIISEEMENTMLAVSDTAEEEIDEDDPAGIRPEDRIALGTDDVEAIIAGITRNSEGGKRGWKRKRRKSFGISDGSAPADSAMHGTGAKKPQAPAIFEPETADYLLIDGYNVIFAWEDLNELAGENLDAARISLLEKLCSWQALTGSEVIVVFDAYRVKGHITEVSDYLNIHVVFTAEAETADQYIEKFSNEHARKSKVAVVTSDGVEQIIIRGHGSALVSSREFKNRLETLLSAGLK